MADSTQTQKQIFNQWMDWQQTFWKDWMDNASKGMESMMGAFQGNGHGGMPWVDSWVDNWRKAMDTAREGVPEGGENLGADVFGRVMDASRVYQELLGFWTKAMGPLAKIPAGGKISADDIKQVHDQWSKDYMKFAQTLWGAVPDKDFQETAESMAGATETVTDWSWKTLEPVFKNLEDLPEIMERLSKGETGAALDMSGVFQKNYEATIGKVLRAPSLGYSREIIEKLNRTIDSYIQFSVAMSEYQTLFANTSKTASERVFNRLSEFEGKEMTPETFREFYRIWWTINEDTYQELFVTKEFTGLLQEVLRRGLTFQQRLDSVTTEVQTALNIPSKDDMDEIYKAIYELRKEVRWHRRMIQELEREAGVELSRPKFGS